MDIQDEVCPHNGKLIISDKIISIKRNQENKVLIHNTT